MSDIGPMLREARMHAGLDISEVEERTKIRAKYLRALENEEWSLLPGTAYTKGFLRSYSDVLGLDWRLLVDEYKREWEEPNELDLSPVRPTIGPDPRDRAASGRRFRWLVAFVAIVVLVLAIVVVGHLLGSKAKAPARGSGSALGTATSPASTRSRSCAPGVSGAVPPGCASLRIRPRAGVRLCLVADGRVRLAGERLRSPTGVFHARRFLLTLASGAATLVVDGRRLVVGRATSPTRYAITTSRVRSLAAPSRFACVA